jgi:hypothetical protein
MTDLWGGEMKCRSFDFLRFAPVAQDDSSVLIRASETGRQQPLNPRKDFIL